MARPRILQRFLDACPACARQYEITHLEPGSPVRCECGEVFSARHRTPRAPRALRCSACGANLREDADACDFCKAEITLEERLLGSVCPSCFARARIDARFCMECGIGIAAQSLEAVPDGSVCPRCKGALRARTLEQDAVIECTGCGGMWLEVAAFDALCKRAERELPVTSASQGAPLRPVTDEMRYIPCLRCSDLMVRRNYGGRSGVVFDLCRAHGVWVDHGEVERIVDYIRAGGAATPVLGDRPSVPKTVDPSVFERKPRSRWQRAFDFAVDVLETLCVRR